MEYPARICVDGVVVADGFPEWYPILHGSRVSCAPGPQSSDQNVNSNINPSNSGTGLTSSTVNQHDVPIMNLSMGQSISCVSHTVTHIDVNNSQLSTQQDVSSQERMEEDGSSSPSSLGNADPIVSTVKSTEVTPEPTKFHSGRSPIRKTGMSGRPRPQSASRSNTRCKPRGTSRSQSKGPQPRGLSDSNQTAGDVNFKKPGPKPNKTDRDKVDTPPPPNQSEVLGDGSPV